MKLNYNLQEITWDIEANNLLNEDTVNYLSSPYKLKDSFDMHCIVVEDHATGQLYGFHKGEKYVFDGRPYNEKDPELDYIYILENYTPIDYIHLPLESFKSFIQENPLSRVVAHNGINYDWLVTKLYYSMPYTVEPDSWCGKKLEIVDTLVMSKTLNPDRFGGHSLDKLSEKVGLRKIDFRPYVKKDDKFKTFAADMLYYCIRDVQVNTKVLRFLEREAGDWDWENAISLEKAVAEIVTRQEHRGFKFNTALAESNISELDALLEERRQKVEPVLPKRKATQAFLKEHTPPVNQLKVVEHKPPKQQFKKDGSLSAIMQKFIDTHELTLDLNRRVVVFEGGELKLPLNPDIPIKKDISLSSHMVSWVEKHNAVVSDDFSTVEVYGKIYPLPMPVEPIKHEMDAKIDDTTHIKEWLVGSFGWSPSEYKEKDLTVNSKKEKLSPVKYQEAVERYVQQTLNSSFCSDRCDFLGVTPSKLKARLLKVKEGRAMKVLTNPCFTRGQEKEICPNLELLSEKFPYAKDVVEYLTYKHRRNSILGGGLDWDGDEEPDKGYMAYVREDGRIPTPADTCGASCVVGDTLILTDNGTVPIVDVGIGDLVLTHNGVYGKVIDRIKNGIKPVAEVFFTSNNSVVSTLNHPYLTPSGWKRLDELKEGDDVYFYQGREEWKTLPNLSNYFISSWGRVMNKEGKYISTCKRTALWDRANVDLIADDGLKHRYGVGRLVLECWVGECPEGYECCHKDGNPMNNFIKNLYWGTSKENSSDAKVHGRSLKAARSKSKLTQEDVNDIREYFLHHGHRRGDDTKLAKKYGVSREHIRDIRLNKRWREGNTINLYKEDFILTKVRAIVGRGEQPTFDLTVEDHHSYIANGIVCHNTSRFKHRCVANIPRITSLYGDKMRALFGVGEGFLQIGYDFDSLEAREEGHYCWRYDPTKEYCNSLLLEKPNDVHSVMARKISEIIKRDFGRSPAKSVKYAATYGATAPKIAKTIGESLSVGEVVFNAFWEAADPLKQLKDNLQKYWERVGGKKFILGIDGRKVPTRSAHAILNSLFQSAGVICAKRAMVIHDRLLKEEGLLVDFFVDDWKNREFCQQLIGYHDECQSEVSRSLVKFKVVKIPNLEGKSEDEIKEIHKQLKTQIEDMKVKTESETQTIWSDVGHTEKMYYIAYSRAGELAAKAVKLSGEYYKLNVDLTAGYMVGTDWASCH